jgi:uncharacterized DUF497 family protein
LDFEWDEDKRWINFNQHGIDFEDAELMFDGRDVVTDKSPYADEERYITVGMIDDRFRTIVWTRRGTATRIISARRSRDSEKRKHRSLYGGGAS